MKKLIDLKGKKIKSVEPYCGGYHIHFLDKTSVYVAGKESDVDIVILPFTQPDFSNPLKG